MAAVSSGGFDCHVHVGKREHFSDTLLSLIGKFNKDVLELLDEEGEIPPWKIEAELDAAGLEYAVILGHDTPRIGIDVPNEYVFDLAAESDRLVPFVSLNPNTAYRPVETLEELVERGAKGLKLYPSYQYFYPNDEHVYPIYRTAAELDVPVTVHTGSSVFEGARSKYARPMPLEDVVLDHPELDLIMAHGGRPAWYEEAFHLVDRHDNLYLDVSSIPPTNLVEKYFPRLEKIADSVLFGSDYPSTPAIAKNLGTIKDHSLPEDIIERMIVENPAALIGP